MLKNYQVKEQEQPVQQLLSQILLSVRKKLSCISNSGLQHLRLCTAGSVAEAGKHEDELMRCLISSDLGPAVDCRRNC